MRRMAVLFCSVDISLPPCLDAVQHGGVCQHCASPGFLSPGTHSTVGRTCYGTKPTCDCPAGVHILPALSRIALDAGPYAALMHVRTPQPRSAALGDSATRGPCPQGAPHKA